MVSLPRCHNTHGFVSSKSSHDTLSQVEGHLPQIQRDIEISQEYLKDRLSKATYIDDSQPNWLRTPFGILAVVVYTCRGPEINTAYVMEATIEPAVKK